jgi:hypothetical protein
MPQEDGTVGVEDEYARGSPRPAGSVVRVRGGKHASTLAVKGSEHTEGISTKRTLDRVRIGRHPYTDGN